MLLILGSSFHVKPPLLLPCVNISKMQQLREQFQTVLNESLRSFSDVGLHFFGDLVEVVELVPDYANEVPH